MVTDLMTWPALVERQSKHHFPIDSNNMFERTIPAVVKKKNSRSHLDLVSGNDTTTGCVHETDAQFVHTNTVLLQPF
jgi:hypothetical protein